MSSLPPHSQQQPTKITLSLIIPVFNEAENLPALHTEILQALAQLPSVEIIYVNDGSTDNSREILKCLQAPAGGSLQVLNFTRNFGQTAAFQAGIDAAKGEVIFLMDGDRQNDPNDIPFMLSKLQNEGYGVVAGWRKSRQDAWLSRKLPSKIANALISKISGVHMHDYGCSLKGFQRSALAGFRLYGEMHRFIPIYAHWQGAKITEVVVNHRPRVAGVSKYGINRTFKVLMDLIVVKFLHEYGQKPMYIFGGCALFAWTISFLSGGAAVFYKLTGQKDLIQTPLPLLCAMSFLVGITCFLLGLIAELLVRTYFEAQGKKTYCLE
jgi:glycosyltransferase involved in cell wall biosynthesis